MKRRSATGCESRKCSRLKRELKGLGRSAASFVPGLGLALSTHDTARKAVRTTHAARDYGDELYKGAKRQIKKRNPFN